MPLARHREESRSIAIAVGLSDAYLGAGFGVTAHSSKEEIERTAETFTAAVEKAL
ncbi:hypothetical protein ABH926_006400 [Catenulispora sp. GP43]|uniref:hypothetical protein n=1 Tax=Catenulispora sp. GP43 TaxID=3156263 RepID=UPI003510F2F9